MINAPVLIDSTAYVVTAATPCTGVVCGLVSSLDARTLQQLLISFNSSLYVIIVPFVILHHSPIISACPADRCIHPHSNRDQDNSPWMYSPG